MGVVSVAPTVSFEPAQVRVWDVFRDELQRIGYVEGKNLLIERRLLEAEDRAAAIVGELLAANVDILVTPNTSVALAAKQATHTVPIVFVGLTDPDRTGLVASLARPSGNLTGIARPAVDSKRLEFLRELAPRIARVAVVWSADNQASKLGFEGLLPHARTLGLTLISVPIRTAGDVSVGLDKARRDGAQALYVHDTVVGHRHQILQFAETHRILTAGASPRWAVYGTVFAYGPSSVDLYRRAAVYVDRILKGARAADLPVEQPQVFELVINLKTAKAIGVTIPPSLLARANQVIGD